MTAEYEPGGGLRKERCSECGERHRVCPECGSRKVTIDASRGQEHASGIGSPEVGKLAYYAAGGASVTFSMACWDCGWGEARTVHVTVDDVKPGGDPDA